MKLLVPPPLVALVVAGAIWLASEIFPVLNFTIPYQTSVSLALCVIAICLDIVAVGLFMRRGTTTSPISPQNAEKLVTTGSYAITRNPMYLGLALLLTALGVWLGTFAVIPAILAYVFYITEFQIKPEEEVLTEKFGEAYIEYCAKVRRWI